MLTDKEIQDKYIEWRSDSINDRFDDCVFCTEGDPECSIPIDKLKALKTPDVQRAIFNKIASIRSCLIVKCPNCNKKINIFVSIKK